MYGTDFIKSNVNIFKGQILLMGSCMIQRWPEIVHKIEKDRTVYHVCMEELHPSLIGHKISTILRLGRTESMFVLTPDGSPHCLMLHLTIDEVVQNLSYMGQVKNFVVEKGKLFEISPQALRLSRHLSEIETKICEMDRKYRSVWRNISLIDFPWQDKAGNG